MSNDTEQEITYSVETRSLGEIAKQEIRVARENDIDPMEFAETHKNLAVLIPALLKQEESNE